MLDPNSNMGTLLSEAGNILCFSNDGALMLGFVVTLFETVVNAKDSGCSPSDLSDDSGRFWAFEKNDLSKSGSGFWFNASRDSAVSACPEIDEDFRIVRS